MRRNIDSLNCIAVWHWDGQIEYGVRLQVLEIVVVEWRCRLESEGGRARLCPGKVFPVYISCVGASI